jgi:hypothetical protein
MILYNVTIPLLTRLTLCQGRYSHKDRNITISITVDNWLVVDSEDYIIDIGPVVVSFVGGPLGLVIG